MCFIALLLMGKLHVFSERGRGQSWRLLISITPLFFSSLIALSRYYEHEIQFIQPFGSFRFEINTDWTTTTIMQATFSVAASLEYFSPILLTANIIQH